MAALFIDSSCLVKRYILETGTVWVINQLRPSAANRIFVANITGIEVSSALARRVKNKSISQTVANKALKRFRHDFDKRFVVIELTPNIIESGISLAQKYALRGYDTAQLAVGLSVKNRLASGGVKDFTFVSADNALNLAAHAEGLPTDNPNDHP